MAAESESLPCLISFLALGLAENFPPVLAAYAAAASWYKGEMSPKGRRVSAELKQEV